MFDNVKMRKSPKRTQIKNVQQKRELNKSNKKMKKKKMFGVYLSILVSKLQQKNQMESIQ